MALKIKWNDDRIRGATTAILLLGRERILRNQKEDLVRECLAEFRADPKAFKINRAHWPDADDLSPLSKQSDIDFYVILTAKIERIVGKIIKSKRQFNSLVELDNWLITSLQNVR